MKMVRSVVDLKENWLARNGGLSLKGTVNCVKCGGGTEAPPVNQAVCGQNAKLRESPLSCTGNASELWVGRSETGI